MADDIGRLLDRSAPPVSHARDASDEIQRLVRSSRPASRRPFWAIFGAAASIAALAGGAAAATAHHDRTSAAPSPVQTLKVAATSGPAITAQYDWISKARVDPDSPLAATYSEKCTTTLTLIPNSGDLLTANQTLAETKLFLDNVDLSDARSDPLFIDAFGRTIPGSEPGAVELRQVQERMAISTVVDARLEAHLLAKHLRSYGWFGATSCEGDK